MLREAASGERARLVGATSARRVWMHRVAPGRIRAGAIVDPKDKTADTEAIRAFNKRVAVDPRGISTLYPGGDGTVVVVEIA